MNIAKLMNILEIPKKISPNHYRSRNLNKVYFVNGHNVRITKTDHYDSSSLSDVTGAVSGSTHSWSWTGITWFDHFYMAF